MLTKHCSRTFFSALNVSVMGLSYWLLVYWSRRSNGQWPMCTSALYLYLNLSPWLGSQESRQYFSPHKLLEAKRWVLLTSDFVTHTQ